jgi:hypothetical protein
MSNHEIVLTGLTKREYIKMIEDDIQYCKCINCGRTSEDESVIILDGDVTFRKMEFFPREVEYSGETIVKYLLCLECSIAKEKEEYSEESESSQSLSSNN